MSPEQLLGSVGADGRTVVADFEAGIGTLSRMATGAVEAVLVVVEPTAKSIEVGSRVAALARERGVGTVLVVGNRLRDDADLTRLQAAFPDLEVVGVPDDPAVTRADREGVAPLDQSPEAPAVRALVDLAARLPVRA